MNGVQHVIPVIELDKTSFCLIMAAASDDSGWIKALLDSAGSINSFEEFEEFQKEVLPLCSKEGVGCGFMILVKPDEMESLSGLANRIEGFFEAAVEDGIRKRSEKD